MTEKRTVYVAYTNTDCTEGRGRDVPIAVCSAEATALRLERTEKVFDHDLNGNIVHIKRVLQQWWEYGIVVGGMNTGEWRDVELGVEE